MIDHKMLNLFNVFFVSSIRLELDERWCYIHYNNIFRNFFVPFLLCLCVMCLGLMELYSEFGKLLRSVVTISDVLRYASFTFIDILSNLLFLFNRKQCFRLVDELLYFDRSYSALTNSWSFKADAKLTRNQLVFASASYLIVLLINLIMFSVLPYNTTTAILLTISVFIRFHFILQQLYVVYFVEHLTIRYHLIRDTVQKQVKQNLLLATLKLYDRLGAMTQLISDAFGFYCLLNSLLVFLNSAIAIYASIVFIGRGSSLVSIFMDSGNAIPTIILFYGNTYAFNKLIIEEQEFKNAVKSLQYTATEEHSEDYLNFLDLINLKLMAESPKITACGLFTVNLQVFYNVFAAIVTYIMILFQFRDFEKA
ncbi:AAEL017158-PC, partial [Aedes aegypti]